VSRRALVLALGLAAIDVVLVNWSQPIFGRWWKHVMWEGGVVEDLTALQFIIGAVVFAMCAFQREHPGAHRVWFALYAVAELMLAGEETNYGTGTLFLDLADPNFAQTYNPQAHNLHNYLIEAYIPVLGLGVICLVLRVFYRQIAPRLRLPMSKEFLDAVLVTAVGLIFIVMAGSFRDERFLSLDEVYEWSSSLLLLCLALYFRFGWVFRPRPGDDGSHPAAPFGVG
jgi:preprotein translocase subunit Sss1